MALYVPKQCDVSTCFDILIVIAGATDSSPRSEAGESTGDEVAAGEDL